MTTVYISIGNSDDKLPQLEWAQFARAVDQAVTDAARWVGTQVHGRWYSLPTEPWQNACWCVDIDPAMTSVIEDLRNALAQMAGEWGQDSIAWAEATTEFLRPTAATHA